MRRRSDNYMVGTDDIKSDHLVVVWYARLSPGNIWRLIMEKALVALRDLVRDKQLTLPIALKFAHKGQCLREAAQIFEKARLDWSNSTKDQEIILKDIARGLAVAYAGGAFEESET